MIDDQEVERVSDDEEDEIDEVPSVSEPEDSDEEGDDFLGFANSDKIGERAKIVREMCQKLQQLQSGGESLSNNGGDRDRLGGLTDMQAEINKNFPISNIRPIKTSLGNTSLNKIFPTFSFSSLDPCISVYSADFCQTRCATLSGGTTVESADNRSPDSDNRTANFSGFEDSGFRWDAAEISNNSILDQVFTPTQSPQNEDMLELDWDDSSLLMDEPGGNISQVISDELSPHGIDHPEVREENIMETIEEEYLEGEITQSPNALRHFLKENYQLTNISSVSDIAELPPSYKVEGEMLLKKRTQRTTSETGETVIEESEHLIVETPVLRPLTRSRGVVTEQEYIMSTPLEWRRGKRK
ncbi:UNVERIFIED_CONTAM: hypothetical protein RMT77_006099 [Armadillidium vulgare]